MRALVGSVRSLKLILSQIILNVQNTVIGFIIKMVEHVCLSDKGS
jgi:hypothetical protein